MLADTHLAGLSQVFIEMTDMKLQVEGQELPAHKALLAANSSVFATLLANNSIQASGSTHTCQEVPLVGETLADVSLVLTYIYNNTTIKCQNEPIQSIDDAKTLARFAHKYDMVEMRHACEEYLISKVSANDASLEATEAVQPLVALVDLAECCEMDHLLTYCEVLLVSQGNSSLWDSKAVVSGQISRETLLRMLRAYQIGVAGMGTRVCPHCRRQSKPIYPTVSEILRW